jgi:hypothetical protein
LNELTEAIGRSHEAHILVTEGHADSEMLGTAVAAVPQKAKEVTEFFQEMLEEAYRAGKEAAGDSRSPRSVESLLADLR